MRTLTLYLVMAAGPFAFVQTSENGAVYEPARFRGGKTPEQPPLASAGGLTIVELDIAASGIVTGSQVLAEAAPYTNVIREASVLWRYQPAKVDGRAVASKALVIGVFRPPVLVGTALPEPADVAEASSAVPYPIATAVPEYPPNALFEGVAVVEVAIDKTGEVAEAKMLSPEAGYDDASLDAATAFRFRPARHDGRPVESFALLFFGFAQPITSPRVPRR